MKQRLFPATTQDYPLNVLWIDLYIRRRGYLSCSESCSASTISILMKWQTVDHALCKHVAHACINMRTLLRITSSWENGTHECHHQARQNTNKTTYSCKYMIHILLLLHITSNIEVTERHFLHAVQDNYQKLAIKGIQSRFQGWSGSWTSVLHHCLTLCMTFQCLQFPADLGVPSLCHWL